MELLYEGLKQLAAADTTAAIFFENRFDDVATALEIYIHEIERFNSAYGLVKADGRETLIVKHILDSLAPLGYIANFLHAQDPAVSGKKLADIGSGAGLPGIPLAICLGGIQVSLIEKMGRRAGFLQNTTAVLASAFPGSGLSRINVEEVEWERAAEKFDLLVLRALSPLDNDYVTKLAGLLSPGGTIAAYKGKHDTAQAELDSIAGFTTELIPITVPFLDEQRCLAVVY